MPRRRKRHGCPSGMAPVSNRSARRGLDDFTSQIKPQIMEQADSIRVQVAGRGSTRGTGAIVLTRLVMHVLSASAKTGSPIVSATNFQRVSTTMWPMTRGSYSRLRLAVVFTR